MNQVGIRLGHSLFGVLLALPLAAQAASMDYLDAYYIADSTLELTDPALSRTAESEDGDGFGVKLATMLGEKIFLGVEYQSSDAERLGGGTGNATVETTRLGLGYTTELPVYVLLEYIDTEFALGAGLASASFADKGFGAHVGVKYELFESVTLEARGGYLDIGDYDGFEYLAGLGLNLDRHFGLFVDYRVSDIENNDKRQFKTQDLRSGFRFRF